MRFIPLIFLMCLLLFAFTSCDKTDGPEDENPEEIIYPPAPEINTVLKFSQAENVDSLGINHFFHSNNRVFALTHSNGVYVSDNNGVSWSASNTGLELYGFEDGPKKYVQARDMDKGGDLLYLLTHENVYRSENNGNLWQATNFKRDASTSGAINIGVFDENTIGVSGGSGRLQYYYSSNYGEDWSNNRPDFLNFMREFIKVGESAYAIKNGDGLIKSMDKGLNWFSFGPNSLYCGAYINSGEVFIAATEETIYSKLGNEDWVESNTEGILNDYVGNIYQMIEYKNWVIALTSNEHIYISKIIDNKVADWQLLELQNLNAFDNDLIEIRNIYYFENKLFVGTIDIHEISSHSTAYGRGIWYADFPLN